MRIRLFATAAACFLLASVRGRAADSVRIFRNLSFKTALKEAAARKKIVMIDFYTQTCSPCKRMDLTTWLDPAVAASLDAHAISLRIDAEKETKLAARYHINLYPTMVFVRPDGSVVDRLLGFLAPDKFLSDFKDLLAGKTALQRARAAAAASAAKGDANQAASDGKKLAEILVQEGDSAGALKEYLWLFDEGMAKLPDWAGVRTSYVPMEIRELGRSYPPALDALRKRHDAAKKRLESPGFDEGDARDWAALNWVLRDSTATMSFFDSLPAGDPRRRFLGAYVFDDLLEARRYAEAADVHPAEKIRAEFEEEAKNEWAPHPAEDAETLRMQREYAMGTAAAGLEVLAGSGKLDDARDLIRRMRAVEDSPWVRAILLKHLKRAGQERLLDPGA
jgi:thioredoxin-related protein